MTGLSMNKTSILNKVICCAYTTCDILDFALSIAMGLQAMHINILVNEENLMHSITDHEKKMDLNMRCT